MNRVRGTLGGFPSPPGVPTDDPPTPGARRDGVRTPRVGFGCGVRSRTSPYNPKGSSPFLTVSSWVLQWWVGVGAVVETLLRPMGPHRVSTTLPRGPPLSPRTGSCPTPAGTGRYGRFPTRWLDPGGVVVLGSGGPKTRSDVTVAPPRRTRSSCRKVLRH